MNNGLNGGSIFYVIEKGKGKQYILEIEKSSFESCNAVHNGGGLYYNIKKGGKRNKCKLIIRDNVIQNNQAIRGGGIYLGGTQEVQVTNNSFRLNKGLSDKSKGGSIYMMSSEKQKIQMHSNYFYENIAEIGKNVFVKYNDIRHSRVIREIVNADVELDRQSIGDNIIDRMKVFSDQMTPIDESVFQQNGLTYSQLNGVYQVSQIQSGHVYPHCLLKVILYDKQNNIITSLHSIQAHLIQNPYTINHNNQVNLTKTGHLCIEGHVLRNNLPIAHKQNYRLIVQQQLGISISEVEIQIRLEVRNCLQGESLQANLSCVECSASTYSFEKKFLSSKEQNCLPCTSSAPFRCLGGMHLASKEGFWRYQSSSVHFLRCVNMQACKASTKIDDQCAVGYLGELCVYCDNQENRERLGVSLEGGNSYGGSGGVCWRCDGWWIKLMALLRVFMQILLFIVYINSAIQMSIHVQQDRDDQDQRVNTFFLMKTGVNHMRLFSIFIHCFPISYSSIDLTAIQLISLLTPSPISLLNIECLPQVMEQKVIIIMVVPLVIVVIYCIGMWMCCSQDKKNKLLVVVMSVIQLCSIEVVRECVMYVQSINLSSDESPISRVAALPHLTYLSQHHINLLYQIIPPLFFYILVFPLFYHSFNKANLNPLPLVQSRFPYKPKVYYWDSLFYLIQLFFLILITCLQQLIIRSQTILVLYIIISLSLILLVVSMVQPFNPNRFQSLNRMQCVSIQTLLLTMYLLLFQTFSLISGVSSTGVCLRTIAISCNVLYLLYLYWQSHNNCHSSPLVIHYNHIANDSQLSQIQPSIESKQCSQPSIGHYTHYLHDFTHLLQYHSLTQQVQQNERLRMQLHQYRQIKQSKQNQSNMHCPWQEQQSTQQDLSIQQAIESGQLNPSHLIIDQQCLIPSHLQQLSLIQPHTLLFSHPDLQILSNYQLINEQLSIGLNLKSHRPISKCLFQLPHQANTITIYHIFHHSPYHKVIQIYAKPIDFHFQDLQSHLTFTIQNRLKLQTNRDIRDKSILSLDSDLQDQQMQLDKLIESPKEVEDEEEEEEEEEELFCKIMLPVMMNNFIEYCPVSNQLAFVELWEALPSINRTERLIVYNEEVFQNQKQIIELFNNSSVVMQSLVQPDFRGYYTKLYGKCKINLMHDVHLFFQFRFHLHLNRIVFLFSFDNNVNLLDEIGVKKTIVNILDSYHRVFS